MVDPINPRQNNSYNLLFPDSASISFFEKKHEVEDIQLDTLGQEMDAFVLFEKRPDPIDISKYLIVFDPYKGIDLYKDA